MPVEKEDSNMINGYIQAKETVRQKIAQSMKEFEAKGGEVKQLPYIPDLIQFQDELALSFKQLKKKGDKHG